MGQIEQDIRSVKKKGEIDRPVTTALYILRLRQTGLSLAEIRLLDTGLALDIVTEQMNDQYDWPEKATQEDFDNFRDM